MKESDVDRIVYEETLKLQDILKAALQKLRQKTGRAVSFEEIDEDGNLSLAWDNPDLT